MHYCLKLETTFLLFHYSKLLAKPKALLQNKLLLLV